MREHDETEEKTAQETLQEAVLDVYHLEYIAEATLEILEGAFYSQWSFLWEGELVRATVGNSHYQITILTDHLDSSLLEIEGFIQRAAGKIKYEEAGEEDEDDIESWD